MCLNETCVGKHLSDAFPIQNGMKQDLTNNPVPKCRQV